MRIESGATNRYVYFVAVDSTDYSTRETGLSSFTVYRSRNGAAAAAMTTPTINETDATNMPGVYELLLDEDMTIGSGNDSEAMTFHITQASMAPVTLEIELYRPKVTAGETLTVASGIAEANTLEINGGSASATNLNRAYTGADIDANISSATSTTIVFDAGTMSAVDDFYNGMVVVIHGGTGVGQSRLVTDYVGSTKTATVSPAWGTTPDATSDVVMMPSSAGDLANGVNVTQWDGTAVATPTTAGVPEVDVTYMAGSVNAPTNLNRQFSSINVDVNIDSATASTVVFDSGSQFNTVDDFYNGMSILVYGGVGAGQIRLVTDYVGSTRTATIAPDWGTTPDATSDVMVVVGASSAGDPSTAPTAAAIRAEIDSNSTQLAAILTDTGTTLDGKLDTVDGVVDAIKVVTDALPDAGALTTLLSNVSAILTDTGTTLDGKIDTIDSNVDAIKLKTDNLPSGVAKNVALSNFPFYMVDATDLSTPETGLTVTATVSKDGAAFGAATNSVSEVSNGIYTIDLTQTEMNADVVTLRFTASGAADRVISLVTDA